MKLLEGNVVVALEEAEHSALARFLVSLGASLVTATRAQVAAASRDADFLIETFGTQRLTQEGIDYSRLAEANPRLIHISVTTFGSAGPYAHWRGGELIASAMGGALRMTGDIDRAPVKEALDACWFHADMVAAAGALAALHERLTTNRGQHIDVSVQEVAFSRMVNGVLVWQFDRRKLQRAGGALNYGRAIVRCIWPLADGYCFHSLMTGRFGAPANQSLSDWMDEVGVDNPLRGVDWLRYNRSTLDAETRARWEYAIEHFFSTRTRDEVKHEGRRRGINATVLAAPRDVLDDPHLRARDFWTSGNEPSRFVAVTSANAVAAAKNTVTIPSRRGPLAGIRVLDFSWALVGSITTKVLGDLGCEVIKVESRTRPCLSRIDVQVSASRADSFDDKPWFAHLNSSKQSLALDMKHAESRAVLEPLIDWADVVVENFSPGTMHKLGLNYERLTQRNPNIIMCSGSVFGQAGPLANEWGVDGTGAALSGRTLLTGWPDRPPVIPSAVPYGDVIVPYVMAATIAAALTQRQQSGRGCHIDASMYEICVQQMTAAISAAAQGQSPTRQGNDDARVFHQGVYATSGDDRWVAITLFDERDWSKLNLGTAHSAATRDRLLMEWFSTQSDRDVVAQLQAMNIAAGVVQDIEDLVDYDPQLKSRGALMSLDHPQLGPFGHMRTPISFSRSTVQPFRAPALGEHNEHIVRTVCGFTAERFAALNAMGIFK